MSRLTPIITTIHGRKGRGPGGAGIDQSVRYPLDEIGSDVSTLLGPAVVLVAIIGILLIALHQPDQTATKTDESRRTPKPVGAGSPLMTEPVRRPYSAPVTMTPAMPPGFRWMEAGPVPRFRSGFALLVILASVGALLAIAVAATVVAIASAIQGTL